MIKLSTLLLLIFSSLTLAVTPTPQEIDQSSTWLHQYFPPAASAATFSFTYADKPSSQLLADWKPISTTSIGPHNEIHRQTIWSDPHSGLRITWIAVEYRDLPVVEWTVYFKNTGPTDTPILSNLQAIDLPFPSPGPLTLHHNVGSPATPTDYQPLSDLLQPGQSKKITTAGGRSTNTDLPFFNLEHDGGGTIIALGWPGQWASRFSRDPQSLRITAGQELTHLLLHPGESVRTPLVALLTYDGDADRGQNLWRKWMLSYNLPKTADGQPPAPMTAACSSHQFGEMIHADEASQKLFIDRYLQEGIKLDYWWMDAGWYVNNGDWPNTGTWEVDPKRFPNGLRAISDHAHSKSVKTLLWFEPERVTPNTWLYDNHPEWLLPGSAASAALSPSTKLLNLGNPDARTWWTNHADQLLTSQGIDLYRTDYNIDPLPFWRAADAPDRQGITENHYVTGLLAYFDELHRRHPGMLIDTCASGGRRNDLEILRRAVPLLRSDYILEPIGQQNHTFGISPWIPYFGTGVESADPYVFRSQMTPWLTLCYDVRRTDWDYPTIRKLWSQWKSIGPTWSGDYYPLTPYNPAPTAWLAWQFDLPEKGQGMVQAFRRPESKETQITVKLKGLDANQAYEIHDLDHSETTIVNGKELMEKGLKIQRDEKPSAIVLEYKQVVPQSPNSPHATRAR